MLSDDQARELIQEVRALRRRVGALERQERQGGAARAWAQAVGMLQMFPGLVGSWPGSGIAGSLDEAVDISGNGLHLTSSGATQIAYSSGVVKLASTFIFDGTNGRLFHADHNLLDITGTETYFQSTLRGLTIGGWVRSDTSGANQGLLTKWAENISDRSYLLRLTSSNTPQLQITSDGSGGTLTTVSASASLDTDTWYFVVARFDPSAELKIWVDTDTDINTTSIPASILNGTADFQIGAYDGANNFFDGHAALCFLCAAAVPDTFIETFYQYSKSLFS